MPSRIDIGPQAGPFVSINENNSDLELLSASGSIIAKWDSTTTQWDANATDITNVKSLNTTDISATDSLTLPSYPTLADVPTTLSEGTLVWVADENQVYQETGI